MRADKTILALAALLAGAVLTPSQASGSDNDERPAYMIYTDPETGKYTTQDPSRRSEDEAALIAASAATPASADVPGRSKVPQFAAGALLLLALIAWGFKAKRARFSSGRHSGK